MADWSDDIAEAQGDTTPLDKINLKNQGRPPRSGLVTWPEKSAESPENSEAENSPKSKFFKISKIQSVTT